MGYDARPMSQLTTTTGPEPTPSSVLVDHYADLRELCARVEAQAEPPAPASFRPPFTLPSWRSDYAPLLEPARMSLSPASVRYGADIRVLDLAGDPATQTTKSVASYLMVLRAIEHIERSGERVWIVTPSSGNKATALRAAVARAHACGLASPEQLGIVSIVPAGSRDKMRHGPLTADAKLRALNPLVTWSGARPGEVKTLAQRFVSAAAGLCAERRVRLWFSLDLRNYRVADVARALFLAERLGPGAPASLTHVHAVSSAYGLLGYHWGHQLVQSKDGPDLPDPRYFLVQHLGAPDMVQYWRTGDFTPIPASAFCWDGDAGVWRQDAVAEWPQRTWSLDEELDSTFYTRRPPTSPEMHELMRVHGGGGVVVSLLECYARYGELRAMLGEMGMNFLPEDPRTLREHSGLMALTGCLEGLARGLIPRGAGILLHHSGTYDTGSYTPMTGADFHPASGDDPDALIEGLRAWARDTL